MEADLYSGYDGAASSLLNERLQTVMFSSGSQAGSNQPPSTARPMTSRRAAGFTSSGRQGTNSNIVFDPFHQGRKQENSELSLEEQIKLSEERINSCLNESYQAASNQNYDLALEKAKETFKREKMLNRLREQSKSKLETSGLQNVDLTFCVLFNLADKYHSAGRYDEAVQVYLNITKNKLFSQSGRLRINIGNIYFEQGEYAQAIKMYRMALDQIPSTNNLIRMKITRNIGLAFLKIGHVQDAITAFESILSDDTDVETAFNLILCNYKLDDVERMKKYFQKLVQMCNNLIQRCGSPNQDIAITEAEDDFRLFQYDRLSELYNESISKTSHYVLKAAVIIAPRIESTADLGYDFLIEEVQANGLSQVVYDLVVAKALYFIEHRYYDKATETLKSFSNKDVKGIGAASNNLAFLLYLEGNLVDAEKYGLASLSADRYNSKAMTNVGNVELMKGNINRARQVFSEAVTVDAECLEALFNNALLEKSQNNLEASYQIFLKLHKALPNHADVIIHLAQILTTLKKYEQAIEWYKRLLPMVPTDPEVLSSLANLYQLLGDRSQAFHYFSESYRYYPANLDVLAWLGAYYIENELYEQAIQYFEKAVILQPIEIKWHLAFASCIRRVGQYQKALECYKQIYEQFPDNLDCLRTLTRLCREQGAKDLSTYEKALAELEERQYGNEPPLEMNELIPSVVAIAEAPMDLNLRTGNKSPAVVDLDWEDMDVNELLSN